LSGLHAIGDAAERELREIEFVFAFLTPPRQALSPPVTRKFLFDAPRVHCRPPFENQQQPVLLLVVSLETELKVPA
jgi:hypothetical protein